MSKRYNLGKGHSAILACSFLQCHFHAACSLFASHAGPSHTLHAIFMFQKVFMLEVLVWYGTILFCSRQIIFCFPSDGRTGEKTKFSFQTDVIYLFNFCSLRFRNIDSKLSLLPLSIDILNSLVQSFLAELQACKVASKIDHEIRLNLVSTNVLHFESNCRLEKHSLQWKIAGEYLQYMCAFGGCNGGTFVVNKWSQT